MDEYEITKGEGRTKVSLSVHQMGSDLVIFIYNQNAHIGAVAVGEYDRKTRRTSTSVITRLGHKDDVVAQKAAYLISKATRKPVCLIAGIHLDNITKAEMTEVLRNTNSLVDEFVSQRCKM
jgi:gallate decarboxylase subunit D